MTNRDELYDNVKQKNAATRSSESSGTNTQDTNFNRRGVLRIGGAVLGGALSGCQTDDNSSDITDTSVDTSTGTSSRTETGENATNTETDNGSNQKKLIQKNRQNLEWISQYGMADESVGIWDRESILQLKEVLDFDGEIGGYYGTDLKRNLGLVPENYITELKNYSDGSGASYIQKFTNIEADSQDFRNEIEESNMYEIVGEHTGYTVGEISNNPVVFDSKNNVYMWANYRSDLEELIEIYENGFENSDRTQLELENTPDTDEKDEFENSLILALGVNEDVRSDPLFSSEVGRDLINSDNNEIDGFAQLVIYDFEAQTGNEMNYVSKNGEYELRTEPEISGEEILKTMV